MPFERADHPIAMTPMTPEELRRHIDAAAPHGGSESRRLAALILSACWPDGPEDRTQRAARDWMRRWRPEQITGQLPVCSCSTGRCVLCN
jgi:hypothetical protein